ncbi:unnamed protein product [Phytomonas sp. EM1]|nr:unnamed protein product [Phytomonas sp. EM1]|eukprot:CCW60572.1 unnamed protein product [Phytomonas sp. isolate EM1]
MKEIAAQARPPTMDNPSTPAIFYVYQEIFSLREANKAFLTNVSSISLWALLLFGASDSNIKYFDTLGVCVIDGWIFVRIDQPTFQVLHDLRHAFHDCLWRRYKDPMNKANNAALDDLRELIKEVLETPLDVDDPTQNRLVDSGVIVSPEHANYVDPSMNEMEYSVEDELIEEDDAV